MKYLGKEKCRILKEIRAEIAKANDIEWVVSECKHQGNCKGTCPKCEQEVRQLEEALAKREALGKKVAVVGISAAISLAVTGCDDLLATGGEPLGGQIQLPVTQEETLMGDVYIPPETEEETVADGETTEPETEEITATAGEPMEYEYEMGEFPE